MKIEICTGLRCTSYGANNIIQRVQDLLQNIDEYHVGEKDELEVKLLPCTSHCKDNTDAKAPIVFINDEMFSGAKSEKILEVILNKLEGENK